MSAACRGCDHYRPIGDGSTGRACHFCLDTGICRSTICKHGKDCTVREVHGRRKAWSPSHKYDFPPKDRWEKEFERLYDQGLSDPKIAAAVGCHPTTVYAWRKRTNRKSKWTLEQRKKRQEEIDKDLEHPAPKEDPCLSCLSKEICRKIGGTCNAKERWAG